MKKKAPPQKLEGKKKAKSTWVSQAEKGKKKKPPGFGREKRFDVLSGFTGGRKK